MTFSQKNLVVPNILSNFALDHRIGSNAEVRLLNVMAHRSGRGGYVENHVVAFLFIINAKNDELGPHNADYVTRGTNNQTKYNMGKGIENLRDYCFNQFGLEFSGGYVVTALGIKTDGFKRWFPLRNFGHHQGDARLFKEVDAPSLSQNEIIMLARNYDHTKQVKRINSHRFIIDIL